MNKKLTIAIIGVVILLAIIGAGIFKYVSLFSAPQKQAEFEQFTVAIGKNDSNEVTQQLKAQGFIRSELGFKIAFFGLMGENSICLDCISPGGYKISKSMDVWQIVKILQQEPYMKWVIIPEGLRKEQTAEILAETLGWSDQQKEDWINKYTTVNDDYVEGVYFPDTYLIPIADSPLEVSQLFINKFNEKFAPYADKFAAANIKWTTALKIASIIQRETANQADMPLIAGIIWNRFNIGMKLQIDATVQYARGDTGEGWWAPITVADEKIDSPYNTYLYKGLPPHPIANPGLDAIDAVLNPAQTDCLFYLHDSNQQIHCAKTYEEHLANIEKYLRN
jgi:UPF0755 protein